MSNRSKGKSQTELTPLQEQGALLLSSGQNVIEVAKTLDVDRSTIWYWRQIPAFEAILNQLRTETLQTMQDGLLALHQQALKTIKRCLSSENETVALKASQVIIEKTLQFQVGETDTEKIELEQQIQKQENFLRASLSAVY
jgi:transposase-like protein|tara:strand:- start:77 stop:499 length:423 start_codon:yes stop_codon:yes gene_type:complete